MSSAPDKFVEYYAAESLSSETVERFQGIKHAVEHAAQLLGLPPGRWKVADIGCGAGTQCGLWARDGHEVHGVDINAPLIELGRKRVAAENLDIRLEIGSATALPWPDASMDICLCPELLEHVADWQAVLGEVVRVLRPGGIAYLSTTNWLCPVQQEFNLPGYSWYPPGLKRHYERVAITTRPELVNHATYPAVNWFTYYELRDELKRRGFRCLDRFDVAAAVDRGTLRNTLLALVKALPPLRFLGHCATAGTMVFAQKTLI